MNIYKILGICLIVSISSCNSDKQDSLIFDKLANSTLYKEKINSKYTVISNLNTDELIPMETDIIISGKTLSKSKGWWALIDTEQKYVLLLEDTDLILGVFSIQNDYLILNEGTSFERSISIYDIHSNYKSKFNAYGKTPVLINRTKNKIAINVLTNKSFELGIDDLNKARIGIEIYDIKTGQIDRHYPTVDENYILESFNNNLIYIASGSNTEIKI